jgi:hypothetical protein
MSFTVIYDMMMMMIVLYSKLLIPSPLNQKLGEGGGQGMYTRGGSLAGFYLMPVNPPLPRLRPVARPVPRTRVESRKSDPPRRIPRRVLTWPRREGALGPLGTVISRGTSQSTSCHVLESGTAHCHSL